MYPNHKKSVGKAFNYIRIFHISISDVSGCAPTSSFASLVSVPVGIVNSAVWLKICAVTAAIKIYKSITKKKGKSKII